jgi:hypothetical protein
MAKIEKLLEVNPGFFTSPYVIKTKQEHCAQCGRRNNFLDVVATGLRVHKPAFLIDVFKGKYGHILIHKNIKCVFVINVVHNYLLMQRNIRHQNHVLNRTNNVLIIDGVSKRTDEINTIQIFNLDENLSNKNFFIGLLISFLNFKNNSYFQSKLMSI